MILELSTNTPRLRDRTGRGVRVAVVDSGIHVGHPHVRRIKGGIALVGEDPLDLTDRLGHGTAVTAAILEKAPDVEVHVVKIFASELATGADTLVRAIEWSATNDIRLVNLSLGTANAAREGILRDAVRAAAAAGTVVIAAREHEGVRWYPGSLDDVVPVLLDWSCPRDTIRIEQEPRTVLRASGLPRPIPGVPPERNLRGISFAVANVTALITLVLQDRPTVVSPDAVLRTVTEHAA